MKSTLALLLLALSCALPLSAQTPAPTGAAPSAPAASTSTLPSVVSAVSSVYVLRPSDAVQILVFREPDLSVAVRINSDGTIMFPLLGRVVLSGLNVQQAQDLITKKLAASFLANPQVTVSVIEYTKKYFTVLGQVGRPGSYEIPVDGKLTLLQAIGMAGGFTRIANPRSVSIKRVTGENQHKVFKVNVKKLATEDSDDNVAIQAEDTISVPESWF